MTHGLINHILIENNEAYRHLKTSQPYISKRVWFTTSPWLLEKIVLDGEQVLSIEAFISQGEMDQIGSYCKIASRNITRFLDCWHSDWPYDIKVGYVLQGSIRRTLFVLLYKFFLIYAFFRTVEQNGGKGLIVGNDELSPIQGFHPVSVGRFDTVFAAIANQMSLPENIKIVKLRNSNGKSKISQISTLGQTKIERLLSFFALNRKVAFSKIWKRLFGARELRLPFKKNAIHTIIFKSCELIEESVQYLLIYTGWIHSLGPIEFNWQGTEPALSEIKASDIRDKLNECPLHLLPHGFHVPETIRIVSEIMSSRINQSLRFGLSWTFGLKAWWDDFMQKGFSTKQNKKVPVTMATNFLTSSMDRALSFFLHERNIPIFSSEHGVTHGLSKMSKDIIEDEGNMLESDHALFYNFASLKMHKKCFESISGIVMGAPLINRKIGFRFFQRYLTQKLLKLPHKERIAVYVANLYSNNYIYNPGICSDYDYHNIKKTIVYEILGKLKNSCVLKLYPTHRYLDDDPFLELMRLPKNVRVIQFFEYRYLRSLCDVNLCDSPQSTLGWVWSARVPLIFLDLPGNPLLPEVAEAFDSAIFRVDCSQEGWSKEVKKLLTLPHRELLKRWKEKEPVRIRVEEKYIFGPPGNVGKRVAKYILEETRKWYADKKE